MRLLPLAAAAVLVLTAGACATPSAETSSAEGRAGATAKAGGEETEGKKKSWWRRHVGPSARQRRPGDIEPGRPGLFSGKDGEIVLFRKGEAPGSSDDPGKPTKLRRR